MVEQTLERPETQTMPVEPEGTRTRERYVTPAVDIYELPEGLVVIADIPGVAKDRLDVRVDHNTLTLRGQAAPILPSEPMYREYELVHYFRQFELSDKVDQNNITADLKHGVLTLTLPKAEAAKPRKIAVAVG